LKSFAPQGLEKRRITDDYVYALWRLSGTFGRLLYTRIAAEFQGERTEIK
jgi:hypothetical protein